MNNDRELIQEALDALTYVGDKDIYSDTIDALRARLAQPENDFNPDWDAMAVMVEEQQRMAKRIEELEARLSQPEPAQCDGGQCGIGGYCKQCPKTQPEQEPVAWRFHDRNMWCYVDHLTDLPQDKFKPLYTAPPQREWQGLTDKPTKIFGPNLEELLNSAGFYRKKEWVGLTDEEVMSLLPGAVRLPPGWADTVRAIEAKLKEKNT